MSSGNATLKAIPTVYKGIQMKSRMEAQCAVLFDKLGWEWEYEKFSLMLPSGLAYIPDFWVTGPNAYPYLMAECRGYKNKRGDRQIDEFAAMVERRPGFALPDGDGNVDQFLVIGPKAAVIYGAGNSKHERETPATKRSPSITHSALLYRCRCGWQATCEWCVNCETRADSALIISVDAGKIFANGVHVEDFVCPEMLPL